MPANPRAAARCECVTCVGALAMYRPGQERVIITTLNSARREFAHWNPEPLPGNRAIIFKSYASPLENSYIEVVDLESGEMLSY